MKIRQCLRLLAAVVAAGLAFGLQAAPRPEIPAAFERIRDIQQRHQQALLLREGVVGVALGEDAAGRPRLQIFTSRKGIAGLPSLLDGEAVGVQVTGRFLSGELAAQADPTSPTARWPRPVPIGVSVGHQDVTAGTLGCQVFQASGCHAAYFILSNNHVLANANLGLPANPLTGYPGDPILQPGAYDGGVVPTDTIANLAQYEPIIMSRTASNVMDAAIAQFGGNQVGYQTPADGYGAPRGSVATATVNLPVKKYGRTSRLTTGKVSYLNGTVLVDYSSGTAQFIKQIIITGDNNSPFSQAGDSGSLVVVSTGADARKAVGLIFAGSGNVSAANPIGPILSRFGVNIAGDN